MAARAFMLKARIHAVIGRRYVPALIVSLLIGAAVVIASAALSDTDTIVGWALVGASILSSIVLALLAWAGLQDTEDVLFHIRINGQNLGEHSNWIAQLHIDVEGLKRDVAELLRRSGPSE